MTDTLLTEREHILGLLAGGSYRVENRMRMLRPLELGDRIELASCEDTGPSFLTLHVHNALADRPAEEKVIGIDDVAKLNLAPDGQISAWNSRRQQLFRLVPERSDDFLELLNSGFSRRGLPQYKTPEQEVQERINSRLAPLRALLEPYGFKAEALDCSRLTGRFSAIRITSPRGEKRTLSLAYDEDFEYRLLIDGERLI